MSIPLTVILPSPRGLTTPDTPSAFERLRGKPLPALRAREKQLIAIGSHGYSLTACAIMVTLVFPAPCARTILRLFTSVTLYLNRYEPFSRHTHVAHGYVRLCAPPWNVPLDLWSVRLGVQRPNAPFACAFSPPNAPGSPMLFSKRRLDLRA
jgi:hypothetical protein